MRAWTLFLVMTALLGTRAFAADDDAKARAQELYRQGQASYERGDYAAALASFEAAIAASPAPGLHYNIAQCHRKLGDPENAIAALERFTSEQKNIPRALRRDVKTQLAEQKKLLAEKDKRAKEAQKVAAAAPPPDPAPVPFVPAPIVMPAPLTVPVPASAPAPAPAVDWTSPNVARAAEPAAVQPAAAAPASTDEGSTPLWQNPIVIGVVAGTALVAAAGAGVLVFAANAPGPTAPQTSLGTTDLR